MTSKELTEPVFEAKRQGLVRAQQYLKPLGIASRHSRPTKAEGLLRVARGQAPQARKALARLPAKIGRVVSAEEARLWSCPECDAPLTGGRKYCKACGCFVGY